MHSERFVSIINKYKSLIFMIWKKKYIGYKNKLDNCDDDLHL